MSRLMISLSTYSSVAVALMNDVARSGLVEIERIQMNQRRVAGTSIPHRQDVDFQLLAAVVFFQTPNPITANAAERQVNFVACGFQHNVRCLWR